MLGMAYAWHMLYVNKLPIDVFYNLDDLEVIVDTQHSIIFVELPMDVSYSLYDLEVIVDTQTPDPHSDPRSPERLYVVRPVPMAAQQPESHFQVGESQPKAIRELANIFDAETQIPNRDALPAPKSPLIKKSSKLPRVEDQTDQPPRMDPYEESKDIEQRSPSTTQATRPSGATRGRYTTLVQYQRAENKSGTNITAICSTSDKYTGTTPSKCCH